MKQLAKILKFEFKNYLQNKIFVGVTVFLIVVIAVAMFIPRAINVFENDVPSIPEPPITDGEQGEGDGDGDVSDLKKDFPKMLIKYGSAEAAEAVRETFSAYFGAYNVILTDDSLDGIKEKIVSGEAECAFVMDGLTSYTYYVNNLSMYDMNTSVANEALRNFYQMSAMMEGGLTAEQASAILAGQIITSQTESLGKDQMQNFFYTYIMIFALYMVILLYGQMVATNVATEKSSRAMELLITSANPVSMMFGKVLASCLAGLTQLIAVFGSAIIFYKLNERYMDDGGIMSSIFNMPVELVVYMLIFFVLGFLIYAFMFGAIGSTASKLEDINTSCMPVILLFVAGFMVVMIGMSTGEVDTAMMKVCSYVPFTSPMAMFTRIAMSTVPIYEIVISVALLIGSVIGVGVLAAKIYRVGVLMYGTPPKLRAILKVVFKG
ncbi:MAG: ABC transporter permease [Clostridia bacterium]|nr:ABC transporter permease [Clostridia bacterium]